MVVLFAVFRVEGAAQKKAQSTDDTLPSWLALLENSGRCLAEQGGKLEVRLQALQRYIDALAVNMHCKRLFGRSPESNAIGISLFYTIHCVHSLHLLWCLSTQGA